MQGKMKAAVMTDLMTTEFEQRDIPQISDKEVLVKVGYVGICGSDLHYYEFGRIGNFIVETPFVLGHEVSGTVVEVGSEVKNLKIGDVVALEPQITCGHCEHCKEGNYNLCEDVEFFATPPIDGVFQEYVSHPADLCFKFPEGMTMLEGAMIEPLSVGFHAVNQADINLGDTVIITGAGCIGLTALQSAKAAGAAKVILSDLSENRLKKAKELGADFVINPKNEDFIERVREITNGRGFDVGIETAGTEITTRQLIDCSKKEGTIVLVGYSASGEETLPIGKVLDKELILKSVFRYRHTYPRAIELVNTKQIDVSKIVTHIYNFDDTPNALKEAIENKDEVVKAAIKVGED